MVNAVGGGAQIQAEEEAGARHRASLPLLQQETRRRRGVPQPGSCDSLEARAAGVLAFRGPLQNAARRARRCHSRRRRLSSSRRARESGGSCGADARAGLRQPRILWAFADAPSGSPLEPRASAPPRRLQAPRLQQPPNFSPPSDRLQLYPRLAGSCRRKRETRAASSRASFSLSRLSPPEKRTAERTKWRVRGQRSARVGAASRASRTKSANSDLKGQSPDCPAPFFPIRLACAS